jgi:D-lactate dehydrogenase
MTIAFYDTKPYDREFFSATEGSDSFVWHFYDFRLSADTAVTAKGAEAVCVFVNDQVDAQCVGHLAELGVRLIALRCAGFNNVDLAAASQHGIQVARVPAYSPHAVAEHTVALLLALNRKLHRAYNRVREFNFALAGLVGFDLHGKTAGIIGTGKIGRITAEILRGFGMAVIAHDPYPQTEWAENRGITYAPLEDLLPRSDVVSLHLPLTPQSRYLLNPTTFELFKPGAYLINTSRGKLIDTQALIQNLKSGRVAGVALDVYEEEEGIFFEDHSGEVPQDDKLSMLLTFPNVLITSHQAFLTREALAEIARVTVDNIRRHRDGEPPVAERAVTAG